MTLKLICSLSEPQLSHKTRLSLYILFLFNLFLKLTEKQDESYTIATKKAVHKKNAI